VLRKKIKFLGCCFKRRGHILSGDYEDYADYDDYTGLLARIKSTVRSVLKRKFIHLFSYFLTLCSTNIEVNPLAAHLSRPITARELSHDSVYRVLLYSFQLLANQLTN
jgi:hypothetical protein